MPIRRFAFLTNCLERATLPQSFRGKVKQLFGPWWKCVRITYTASRVKCKVLVPHHYKDGPNNDDRVNKFTYKVTKAVFKVENAQLLRSLEEAATEELKKK